MANYPNFYETVKEANMRLRGTLVLYDGIPNVIHAIADHKGDGIFRAYIEEIGDPQNMTVNLRNPPPTNQYEYTSVAHGQGLDSWMDTYPKSTLQRKFLSSPLFDKFRPFPLGMMHSNGMVSYLERRPLRKSEQGLLNSGVKYNEVQLRGRFEKPNFWGKSMRDCILGIYPSVIDVLEKLKAGACGFGISRDMALIAGPVGTVFLVYQTEIVGHLNPEEMSVRVTPEHGYSIEAIRESGLFSYVS